MILKTYLKETAKYILRSRPLIRKYINEVEHLYRMSPEELRQRNNDRFLEIFRKAYNNSPFYNRLYTEAGISIDDIRSIDDLHKLPLVTKEMVRANGKDLLTRSSKGLITNTTSGTTGSFLKVYEDWPAVWREQAYFVAYRRRCGFNYGDPIVSLRGTLDSHTFSMKLHASNTLYLSSMLLRDDLAERFHSAIKAHRPKAIEGFPSSLFNLATSFKRRGLTVDVPLAFTSSENMYDYQRELIEEVFNCKIFDHYGTTERTLRLEQLPDNIGYYEDPGYGIAEYRDNCVVATSLINDVFPLIRYVTDDTFELFQDRKPEATDPRFPAPDVRMPVGRAIAYIVAKDGTHISDSSLTFIFKDNTANVEKAQFVQERKGEVSLNLVTSTPISQETIDSIKSLFDARVGHDKFDLTINVVTDDQIKYTSRNKFALVISKL